MEIQCLWNPFITDLPYKDEHTEIHYDSLGYFRFEIEFYRNSPERKERIQPFHIQQIAAVVSELLKKFDTREDNRRMRFDRESPVFIFIVSNRSKPGGISWSPENIEKYKKCIGEWTEIYSGQWEDYSESLFHRRVQGNLSNRLSELHFIRRNSGFIYMEGENYTRFFESYVTRYVLEPTAQIRAMLYAMITINESLDLTFIKLHSEAYLNIDMLNNRIKKLKYLRGVIQTKLSLIFNELDYNRRQHFTAVLEHLLKEFNLENAVSRVNSKFDIIHDSMQELHAKKSEENQARTERGLNILNILFGAGVFADFAAVCLAALSLQSGNLLFTVINGTIALLIGAILVGTSIHFFRLKMEEKSERIGRTVDAVIEDGHGRMVLIKRQYPPFQNCYALPGGFVKKGENIKQALIREVMEETRLPVEIVKKIGVYKAPGRDPRGNIVSTAFRCKIAGSGPAAPKGGSDALSAMLISIDHLDDIDLAFDHRQIIIDAGLIKSA
jgi:8-oxo-dGTP diphosphatase